MDLTRRELIRSTVWHKWFAWRPVWCKYNERGVPSSWAWLRWVWRKQIGQRVPGGPWMCYSLPWRDDPDG
jgi:hypothetical protein